MVHLSLFVALGLTGSRSQKQLNWEPEPGSTFKRRGREYLPLWTPKTPPPTTTSESKDNGTQDAKALIPKSPPVRLLLSN